jgi:flagellar biosynthesis/type III secretory pathway protein FliH
LSKRIIKGSTLPIIDEITKAAHGSRRIIPKDCVRIERQISLAVVGERGETEFHHEKGRLKDYLPLSTKINLKNPSSSLAINQLVEERVREFEERFQQEKEQAFSEGINQGETRGYKKCLGRVDELEKLLNNLVMEFGEQKDKLFKEMETVVGRLALDIAEAVIGEAAATVSGQIIEQNLKRCLTAMKGSGRVKIRINPIDFEFAREYTKILERAYERFNLEFEPDPSIAPGGCLLESSSGAVDGRLESQFEIVKDTFLQI